MVGAGRLFSLKSYKLGHLLFAKKSFNLGVDFAFIIICFDLSKLAPFINAKNLLQFVCLLFTEER